MRAFDRRLDTLMDACARVMIGAHLQDTNDLHREEINPARQFSVPSVASARRVQRREPNFICERSDKFVPAGGKGAGDAMLVPAEAGQNQKPAIGQRFLPVRCETHFFQTSGSTNDDGLTAAQENAETFFFHRRMKTADDAATSIAPAGGLVVGGEDGVAGATGGTK